MRDTTYSTFVGLDVHKDSISLAIADLGRGAEVGFYGTINKEPAFVDRLLKRLSK